MKELHCPQIPLTRKYVEDDTIIFTLKTACFILTTNNTIAEQQHDKSNSPALLQLIRGFPKFDEYIPKIGWGN